LKFEPLTLQIATISAHITGGYFGYDNRLRCFEKWTLELFPSFP